MSMSNLNVLDLIIMDKSISQELDLSSHYIFDFITTDESISQSPTLLSLNIFKVGDKFIS